MAVTHSKFQRRPSGIRNQRKMRNIVERYLGDQKYQFDKLKAMITVPASFTDSQRRATKLAAEMSGFDILAVVNEPTAAAIAYGFNRSETSETILVVDLGGGKLDVSIIRVTEGRKFEVLSTTGIPNLGGEDFDERLVQNIIAEFEGTYGANVDRRGEGVARLRLRVEEIKRGLDKPDTKLSVHLEAFDGKRSLTTTVTTALFSALCSDLFVKILEPIDEALRRAGLKKPGIDTIVLSGSGSRVPKIHSLIMDHINYPVRAKVVKLAPGFAAGGAAVLAHHFAKVDQDLMSDDLQLELHETSSYCIGVEDPDGFMVPLIPQNTRIPMQRTFTKQRFATQVDGTLKENIDIFEGDEPVARMNRVVGYFPVRAFAKDQFGMVDINVTFEFDRSGILRVIALDNRTDKLIPMRQHGIFVQELEDEHPVDQFHQHERSAVIAHLADISEPQLSATHPAEPVTDFTNCPAENKTQEALKNAEQIITEVNLVETMSQLGLHNVTQPLEDGEGSPTTSKIFTQSKSLLRREESMILGTLVERVEKSQTDLLVLFKDCHFLLLNGDNREDLISCSVTYTFTTDISELSILNVSDYGRGKFKRARILKTGLEIRPFSSWLQEGISMQISFAKKIPSTKWHKADGNQPSGYEIPWSADICVEHVPDECILQSVRLSFINPEGQGSPITEINAQNDSDLSRVNEKLLNIKGQTYCESSEELGVFRKAYCYVQMLVPVRKIVRQQFSQLRQPYGTNLPAMSTHCYKGPDNVTLRNNEFSIDVNRASLINVSAKTAQIFADKSIGKVGVFYLDITKEAILAVLHAAIGDVKSFALDPYSIPPRLIYELLFISTAWDISHLKLWSQLALVERIATPGFDLNSIPMSDSVEFIWSSYDFTGTNVVLSALVLVLRSMDCNEARWLLNELFDSENEAHIKTLKNATEAAGNITSQIVVFVKMPSEEMVILKVDGRDTVGRVKALIAAEEDLPIDQQRILFYGRTLDEDSSLTENNVQNGAVLNLLIRKQ
ncbi:uncharacterized protein LOC129593746 isoform X2 [Paramacrobiotus metropolitanus]|uniref:uncharacterized protein LOC129593746 isoform X2 n=1 Tax=Paramacrobiotus metropolitanus TaxID=2943436 RepID=UPI002445B350|nr:uncharacterized protein LOC129593746 isoform X2 [Paramacrobiotus metropolitanus]